jgi:hypothetical protein
LPSATGTGGASSLSASPRDRNLPHANTIRNWIGADTQLRQAYRTALETRAEILAEFAMKAAAEEPPAFVDATGNRRIAPTGVRLIDVRIRTLQWLAAVSLELAEAEAKPAQNSWQKIRSERMPRRIREAVSRVASLPKSRARAAHELPEPNLCI